MPVLEREAEMERVIESSDFQKTLKQMQTWSIPKGQKVRIRVWSDEVEDVKPSKKKYSLKVKQMLKNVDERIQKEGDNKPTREENIDRLIELQKEVNQQIT